MVKCVICDKELIEGDLVYNFTLPTKIKLICCNYHMENGDLNKYISKFITEDNLPKYTVEVNK